jgi:hypothetical protein
VKVPFGIPLSFAVQLSASTSLEVISVYRFTQISKEYLSIQDQVFYDFKLNMVFACLSNTPATIFVTHPLTHRTLTPNILHQFPLSCSKTLH